MDLCSIVSHYAAEINWWWFAAATIVSFAIGGVWYSLLFSKAWIRVFKVEMEGVTTASVVRTMLFQLLTTMFLGAVFFVLTNISVWIAILTLVGICGWEKGKLNFQFSRRKDFLMAVVIEVGHTFVVGMVFILFALL
ncbi:MAG: DUF1761 domain-containing protein [Bacteroidetes bacterium]|nr:DUF1761 domain-containing protein [Bacteroidota bacterium]